MRTLCLILTILTLGCSDESFRTLVYSNDFENGDLDGIMHGVVTEYNGGLVLGNYNNEHFSLHIANLPSHDIITIAFDLYAHDSWDGNRQDVDGPDTWSIHLDDWQKFENELSERRIFKTSFSNGKCSSAYCIYQSFPERYPFIHDPGTNAEPVSLPELCSSSGNLSNGTSLYKMKVIFPHSSESAAIKFEDQLVQTNAEDPKCDESWSVDNIEVYVE